LASDKPAAQRSYASGFTHVNFTAVEMRDIQRVKARIEVELGITLNSSRQALVLLVRRYLKTMEGY
jgi:hypothetical protein